MVAPQKRSAESSNDAGAKKGKFDKSSQFKKSGGGKFDAKKSFGKPGTKYLLLLSISRLQWSVFDLRDCSWYCEHCPFFRFDTLIFILVNKMFSVFFGDQSDPRRVKRVYLDFERYHICISKVPSISSFQPDIALSLLWSICCINFSSARHHSSNMLRNDWLRLRTSHHFAHSFLKSAQKFRDSNSAKAIQ